MKMKENKAREALFKIQKKLYEVGELFRKDGKNIHFKSKYLQLPDLLAKVVPLLHDEGCMLLQGTRHSDNADIAIITTEIVHMESGDSVVNETDLPVAKLSPQDMGKAVTYGRRYSLEPLFGIPTKDDDGESGRKAHEPVPTVDIMDVLVTKSGLDEQAIKDILKPMGIDSKAKIKKAGITEVLNILKEAVNE
jgi:hypothetical protein